MPYTPARQSLSKRLSFSLGILSTSIVLVVSVLVFLLLTWRVGKQIEDQAESTIIFLTQALESPFWSLDKGSAVAVAQATAMDPNVGLLELSDSRGQQWFAHETGKALYITREADVSHDGQVIGHIRLGLENSYRIRILAGIGLAGGGIALFIILAQSFFAARALRSYFQKPFKALDALVAAYAHGDYSPDDPGVHYTEFEPLVHAFLGMGKTIERQLGALAESEEKYRAIFQNSPVGIFRTTFDGVLIEGNPALGRMFGYVDRDDFYSANGFRIDRVYADPAMRQKLLQALTETSGTATMEMQFVRRDGSLFDGVLTASVQSDDKGRPAFLNGVVEDVSARRQAERSLAQERLLMAAIFESVPGLLYLYDNQGRLVRWNKAHETVMGYSAEEMQGRNFLDWFGGREPHASRVASAVRRVMDHGSAIVEAEMLTKDGRAIPFYSKGVSVVIDGERYLTGIGIDITERKKAEEALIESEKKFKNLFDTMPNGFYRSTPAGYFVDANPSYLRMLGYDSLDELRQVYIPSDVFVHESERDDIIPDNAEFVDAIENYRLRRKDGQIIWVEDNARYIKDEHGNVIFHEGICRDITDRKRAEESLRQSEEKFSRLFRLSPDVIILMRLDDGRIIDVNDAFSRLTGFGNREAVGRTVLDLGLYDSLAMRDIVRQRMQTVGQIENIDFSLRRKDGAAIPCVLSSQMLSIDGEPCVMAVLRDVTEFKRMQEMMIQSEKMISVGGIAAGVAHEINNPLGIIMVSSQNLAQRTRPDFPKNIEVAGGLGLDMNLLDQYMRTRRLHEFIGNIQEAAVRAADIIRHMLDFSRRSESKRKVCDLRAIIERAVHLAGSDYDLKKNYDFRKIQIVWECEDNLPKVNCTETEIEQVFLNLLRNAAQAMASAQSEVVDPRVVVRMKRREDRVVVEVDDNGPGMPPEVQRRAFEPFFTTKPPGVGTGLGLSVSYFIITRSHDGLMSVESDPGVGTKFIIELPAFGSLNEKEDRCIQGS
jgi:PAS domain S-box-containing protein